MLRVEGVELGGPRVEGLGLRVEVEGLVVRMPGRGSTRGISPRSAFHSVLLTIHSYIIRSLKFWQTLEPLAWH